MNRFFSFIADDRGTISVEYLLWLPMYLAIFMITVDTCMVMTRHSEMYEFSNILMQRAIDPNVTTNLTDLQNTVDSLLQHVSYDGQYSASVAEGPLADSYQITIARPLSEALIFGKYMSLGGAMYLKMVVPKAS